jgi:hypothetical protein
VSFHYCNLATSSRLRDALRYLKDSPEGLSGLAWSRAAGILSPGTVASELNRNLDGTGRQVTCRYEGKGFGSRRIYRYRLERIK